MSVNEAGIEALATAKKRRVWEHTADQGLKNNENASLCIYSMGRLSALLVDI
jgi:hypothetical protein